VRKITLDTERHHKSPKKKRKFLALAALGILVVLILWSNFSSSSSVFNYVFSGGSSIKQTDGRVNILLLGIGGGNHDGADLTDSIIVASYNLKTNEVTMFSVPRDVWLPGIKQKVNAAYEMGKAQGNGLQFAGDKIDDILGIPIHYEVLMDFAGFSKAIDLIGGVDVSVPNTFDDFEYPIDGKENDLCGWKEDVRDLNADQAKALNVPVGKTKLYVDASGKVATDSATLDFGCRYEHIHFDKGVTHMDGTTALKFVRSRHAFGVEGSDFARSKRQQLVIQAFRDKVFSLQTLSNPQKVFSLIGTFGDSFKTNIPSGQYLEFYNLAKKVKKTNSVVLGDLGNGKSVFYNPPLSSDYGGAWVLVPQNNNFDLVAGFVHDTLNPTPTPSGSAKPVSTPIP
jgi:anionic cell wall polymer biosynthesis LytR-Cps2A-Psr (LCP) family protein